MKMVEIGTLKYGAVFRLTKNGRLYYRDLKSPGHDDETYLIIRFPDNDGRQFCTYAKATRKVWVY